MPNAKSIARAAELRAEIRRHGAEILRARGMLVGRAFVQHGDVSVYEHCVNVAFVSLYLARRPHIPLNRVALVRGALLHDYFQYDWHKNDPSHRLHGFHHAKRALENACRDFALTARERDVIAKHMFPLNLRPPRYRESVLVCATDKMCAVLEVFGPGCLRRRTGLHSTVRSAAK